MDELQRSLLNVFTYSDLDREVIFRKNPDRIEKFRNHSTSRYLLFCKDRYLAHSDAKHHPVLLSGSELKEISNSSNAIYLGSRSHSPLFVVETEEEHRVFKYLGERFQFAGLREQGYLLRSEDATLLAYSKALLHWHRSHRFCGVCGSQTKVIQSGHARKCVDSNCSVSHFPRVDPAIIVAVTRDDKCLFGRQAAWPLHRFSVIAGFVEPGESIEQAVVREVREETNIELSNVYYHSSQPWPFPGSIMLGFTALASSLKFNSMIMNFRMRNGAMFPSCQWYGVRGFSIATETVYCLSVD